MVGHDAKPIWVCWEWCSGAQMHHPCFSMKVCRLLPIIHWCARYDQMAFPMWRCCLYAPGAPRVQLVSGMS
jgi:hypothetical protein